MDLFLDDSGSFSWHNRGRSLFAGLTVPDRALTALLERFERWRSRVAGGSRAPEIKAKDLTSAQLSSLVREVLCPTDLDVRVTVVAANTKITSEKIVEEVRDQVAAQFARAAELVRQHSPSKKALIRDYTEMSGWVRNRSTPNVLWINVLEEAIQQTVQHSVVYYMEPVDDAEFENIEIIVDRSFIHRERHVGFWKEWLRTGLSDRTSRTGGFMVPNTWARRGHPFIRKYRKGRLFNFSNLFRNHLHFSDSKRVSGLQIADMCANICYRHWRGGETSQAYQLLRPRIVGRDGRDLTTIHFTTEDSLIRNGIENHVHLVD